MAHDLLALMWAPFLMCLVLTGIHAYLGLHVIAREVIFVDIALAQIASLGATAAFLWGYDLESLGSSSASHHPGRPCSRSAGAASAVSPRKPSSAWSTLSRRRRPRRGSPAHGAEHLRNMLVGSILAVRGGEVLKVAGLYAGIGIFHWLCRRPFLSSPPTPNEPIATAGGCGGGTFSSMRPSASWSRALYASPGYFSSSPT
jgi:zinc/manganese transport system permease protein